MKRTTLHILICLLAILTFTASTLSTALVGLNNMR